MNIAVLGDSGLLGQALVKFWGQQGHSLLGLSSGAFAPTPFWPALQGTYRHVVVNIADSEAEAKKLLSEFRPDVIVNCVAIVNLNGCENNPALAKKINTDLAVNGARIAKDLKARFVQISTDQVFNGLSDRPYRETDAVDPQNVYGSTKQEAEARVLALDEGNLVLRTNIVGFRDRASQPTFAEWLFGALAGKQPITLFTDYITSSMHVDDFSHVLDDALTAKLSGLFHVASHEGASKLDFGREVAKQMGFDLSAAKTGTMGSSNLVPRRPPYLALDVSAIEARLERTLPTLAQTVEKLVSDYRFRTKEERYASKHS